MKFCHCILAGTKACENCGNFNGIAYSNNAIKDLAEYIDKAKESWSGIDTDKGLDDLSGRG